MIGEMRQEAERLYRLAVAAADPEAAVRAALERQPPAGPVRVLALGKAGVAMARSALAVLGDRVREALVITNAENAAVLPGAELVIGGHPVPDAGSERAGQAVEALLTRLCPGEVLLALISGGGSALMVAPVSGVTLDEKAAVSRLLLGAGLDITAMNMVRQHLSRLKGGGLLRLAGAVPVAALILSDVVGDDLAVIASGPTVAPIASRAEVRNMLRAQRLWTALPASVRHALERAEPEGALPAAVNRLIGSNGQSLAAMAVGGGEIWHARLEGDVSDAADWLVARMKAFHDTYDILLTPTVAVAPFPLGTSPQPQDDHWFQIAGRIWSPYTFAFNMTHQPAASIPCGLTGPDSRQSPGLPIGLQIVAAPFRDDLVLRASQAFEASRQWDYPVLEAAP